MRDGGSKPIRTSSPAACASAWRSPSRCSTGPALIIVRRADHGARRLDPGAGPGRDEGPRRDARHGADLDQPRPRDRVLARRAACSSCTRAASSRRGRSRPCCARRAIPTRAACSTRCPPSPSPAATSRRFPGTTPSLLKLPPAAPSAALPARERCVRVDAGARRDGARGVRCHHPLAMEAWRCVRTRSTAHLAPIWQRSDVEVETATRAAHDRPRHGRKRLAALRAASVARRPHRRAPRLARSRTAPCTPSTASASRSPRARCWASSANPAAGSRRSGASSPAFIVPTDGHGPDRRHTR